MTMLSPSPAKAFRAWQSRFIDTPAFGALTDWQMSVAPDGRLLHTARVNCPRAFSRLQEFVNGHRFPPVLEDQPRPFLDLDEVDELGRVSCVWLVDGQWVQFWTPEPQPPAPVPAPVRVGMSLETADALLASTTISTPSARLRFTRRPKTRKEPAA